jgi:hypothetical protein
MGLVALMAIAEGCDCMPEVSHLPRGATVGGIDPDTALMPLFKTTNGVLTWTFAAKSTPVHLTVARGQVPAVVEWDECSHTPTVAAISVPIYVEVRTDDGLVFTTMSGLASEDSDGKVESIATNGFPSSDISDSAVLSPCEAGSLGWNCVASSTVLVALNLTVDGGTGFTSGQFGDSIGIFATLEFTR